MTRSISVREADDASQPVVRGGATTSNVQQRDAYAMEQHREAAMQDKMGDKGYLPGKADLRNVKKKTGAELRTVMEKQEIRRGACLEM